MKPNILTLRHSGPRTALAMLCVIAIGPGDALAGLWVPTQASVQVPVTDARPFASAQTVAGPLSADRLDSLVAPIALYPDPLLAQALAAATYPTELEELNEFLGNNPGLQGTALANAVAAQPWDPSVQSMAPFPDVVTMMADNIDWTTDLGNAFIAQESDVMNAVQRMRQRAESTGNLRTTDQQIVKKTVIENHPVIMIEPADPQVVFVPYYDPAVVFGPALYPFPVFVSPRRAGLGLAFGAGVGMGAFWGVGGGWGWHPGWGRRNRIMINHNNFFLRNSAFYRNRSTWAHNRGRRGWAGGPTVGTTGRGGSRRDGRWNSNRVAGTTGRSDVNRRGNVGSRRGTSGNREVTRNRPTGTSGRAQVRRNIERSNRALGTTGPGSVSRANRGGAGGGRTRGTSGNANRGNRGGAGGGRRGGQR
jgi:hypothetical protein